MCYDDGVKEIKEEVKEERTDRLLRIVCEAKLPVKSKHRRDFVKTYEADINKAYEEGAALAAAGLAATAAVEE